MSAPSINLDCEKCDFHGCTTVSWGIYSYLINEELELSINRTLGWCFTCETFKPIESFDSDDILNEALDCIDELKKLEPKLLLQFFKKPKREKIE